MLFSCESCLKGKQLTLNPRQDHMKITYHIYCELLSQIDHMMCIPPLNYTKNIQNSADKLVFTNTYLLFCCHVKILNAHIWLFNNEHHVKGSFS